MQECALSLSFGLNAYFRPYGSCSQPGEWQRAASDEEKYSLNNNRNNRRRGRNNNRVQSGGNQANRIDSRARGNAPQLLDKYKKLAQDAQHNGDRVQMEYYLQFADHYFRVVADNKARQDEARVKRQDGRSSQSGNARDNGKDSTIGDDQTGGDDESRSAGQRRSYRDQPDDSSRTSGVKGRKSARLNDRDSDDTATTLEDEERSDKAKPSRGKTVRTSRSANGNDLPLDDEPAPYPPADAIAIDEDVLPPAINVEPEKRAAKKPSKPRKTAASTRKAASGDDEAGLSAAQ